MAWLGGHGYLSALQEEEAVMGIEDFDDFQGEFVVHHDDFAFGNELVIHHEVDCLTGQPIQFDDRTLSPFQDLRYRQCRASQLDGYRQLDVQEEVDIPRHLAGSGFAELWKLGRMCLRSFR